MIDKTTNDFALAMVDSHWQLNKTLSERNAFMFNNELASDVHFTVHPPGFTPLRLPAHRYVLATASPVFFAMFYGPLATGASEIDIPDIDPEAFVELLRFVYCEEVRLSPHLVMPTLYAAKKYIMPLLIERCKDFLQTRFNLDNISTILNHSLMFDETDLTEKCVAYIDQNAKAVFMSDAILRMSYESLLFILPRDTLKIDEILIFSSLNRWAEYKCHMKCVEASSENRREMLGALLALVRFPIMHLKDFANKVSRSGILSSEELNALFQYFCCDVRPPVQYINKHRHTHEDCQRVRCERFPRTSSGWGYTGEPDQVAFKVDHPIYLLGVSLYGSPSGPEKYYVDIKITENDKTLHEDRYGFQSDGNTLTYDVLLGCPVYITAEASCTIYARLNGACSFYGQDGYRSVTHGGVLFEFMEPHRTSNGTGPFSGQIPAILFCSHPE